MPRGLGRYGRPRKHVRPSQPCEPHQMDKHNPFSRNIFGRFFRSWFIDTTSESGRLPSANDSDDVTPPPRLAPPSGNTSSNPSSQYSTSPPPHKGPEARTFSKVFKWLKPPKLFTSGKVSHGPPIPDIIIPGISTPKIDAATLSNTGTGYSIPDRASLSDPKDAHQSEPLPKPPSPSPPNNPFLHPNHNALKPSPPQPSGEADEDPKTTWFRQHPLLPPLEFSATQVNYVRGDMLSLTKPQYGSAEVGTPFGIAWTRIRTKPGSGTAAFTSARPIYAASYHAPTADSPREIYFEVNAMPDWLSNGQHFSLGFAGHPFPDNCLPGYERRSVGFHIDAKYLSLCLGSQKNRQEISALFTRGDRVGIGMRFSSQNTALPNEVEVFVTLNGEELDTWPIEQEDEKLVGLNGDFDIFPMVGTVNEQYLEVKFRKDDWKYESPEDRY